MWLILGDLIMSSIWDLIIVLMGSFLALRIALLIYRKQEMSVDLRLKMDQRQKYLNRLKCFLLFINSIIENAKNQYDGYNELIKKIKEDPYEIHKVKLETSNDLRRVSLMDSEALFSAYIYFFESSDASLGQYVKLFGRIDFIEILLRETFASLERHHHFIHRERTQVKDLFNELADNVSSVLFNFGFNYDVQNELAIKPLNKSLEVYRDLSRSKLSKSNLIEYEVLFSQPLRVVLVNDFRHLHFADILASKSQRASNLLSNIKYNSSEYAIQIKKSNEKLIKAINALSLMHSKMNERISAI